MRFALKDFQKETMVRLAEYCNAVRAQAARETAHPDRDAFEAITGRSYFAAPGFEGVPYVCIRIPTGGGKTILAAHAVGTIGRGLQGTDRPACLWITPSTVIRDQTLRALRSRSHPYRLALEDSLSASVEVVTMEEALTTPRTVQSDAALVIVTTIQSYRIRDERGEELSATRRIYRDNGYLQNAFENLPAWARAELACDENGVVNLSLANALKLRAPIVIMDEAHNARTTTSFESLARFGPSFVLELTATPEQKHDPRHPTNPRFASNVLHAASALELKDEGIIKLPVDLESRGDWLEVLAATVQRRDELETIADRAHQDIGVPFYRPIALIQAQPASKTKETHTADKVKAALLERFSDRVQPEHVVICTGSIDEIGDTDLMAENCPIRYVITVEKLREGWDCPLAYVLGSIGNAATATAVEQLIGRVLRMPNATPTRVPALDRAYAFVLSDNVVQTAMQLRDRMVESCGFDERSADEALRVTAIQGQERLPLDRIPIITPPAAETLPPALAQKTHYDEATKTLVLHDLLDRGEIQALRESLAEPEDREAVEAYWQRERPIGSAAKPLGQYAKPLRVARLTVRQGERRSLFEPAELDTFSWNLHECDPSLTEMEFASDVLVGNAATIDVEASPGRRGGGLVTKATGDIRLRQLELIGEGDDWSEIELTRWLDREIHRGDSFMGLPLKESQPWLHRVVDQLLRERKLDLPIVVRRRHRLAELLRIRIASHGRAQVRRAAEWLIQSMPDAVETSDDFAVTIEEQDYRPYHLFERRHIFSKHAFDLIAEMNGEEAECATRIDGHANVARWIRNPANPTQGGFCLPKSPGRFFPDFIVELRDGTIVLVEYKMGKMASDPEEQHKHAVGQLWADRSNGRGRFAWVVDKDWQVLEETLR